MRAVSPSLTTFGGPESIRVHALLGRLCDARCRYVEHDSRRLNDTDVRSVSRRLIADRCLVIDDQFAVIPARFADTYFGFKPCVGPKCFEKSVVAPVGQYVVGYARCANAAEVALGAGLPSSNESRLTCTLLRAGVRLEPLRGFDTTLDRFVRQNSVVGSSLRYCV